MNKHKSNKIKENSNTVRHLIMGQITTTQNLVAIKEVRHAGQWWFMACNSTWWWFHALTAGVRIWALIQYVITWLILRYCTVSKPQGLYWELSDHSEIWQATRLHCCCCCLSNFTLKLWFKLPISQLRGLATSYNKTFCQILKQGPGIIEAGNNNMAGPTLLPNSLRQSDAYMHR